MVRRQSSSSHRSHIALAGLGRETLAGGLQVVVIISYPTGPLVGHQFSRGNVPKALATMLSPFIPQETP